MDIEVYALVSAFIVAIREIVGIIGVVRIVSMAIITRGRIVIRNIAEVFIAEVGIEWIICKTVYRSIGIISIVAIVIGAVAVSF